MGLVAAQQLDVTDDACRGPGARWDLGVTLRPKERTSARAFQRANEQCGKDNCSMRSRGLVRWKSAYVIYNSDRPPAIPGAMGPAVMSPLPALRNYYAAIGNSGDAPPYRKENYP